MRRSGSGLSTRGRGFADGMHRRGQRPLRRGRCLSRRGAHQRMRRQRPGLHRCMVLPLAIFTDTQSHEKMRCLGDTAACSPPLATAGPALLGASTCGGRCSSWFRSHLSSSSLLSAASPAPSRLCGDLSRRSEIACSLSQTILFERTPPLVSLAQLGNRGHLSPSQLSHSPRPCATRRPVRISSCGSESAARFACNIGGDATCRCGYYHARTQA